MSERMVEVKVGPQQEACSWCGGYGLRYAGADGVEDCTECGGGGMVEKRDERGRFLPWETALIPEKEYLEYLTDLEDMREC
jgi:DnaJ-class molecular chaperone